MVSKYVNIYQEADTANSIAVIWDCDKTLADGYMQDSIFEKYHINSSEFWKTVNARPEEFAEQNICVNKDTYYLNCFIECVRNGIFGGEQCKAERIRKKQKFYKGISEIFEKTKNMFKDDKNYAEYGIQVEHCIVSSGFAEVIRGSKLMPFADGIWGCELPEAPDENGNPVINEIGYTI